VCLFDPDGVLLTRTAKVHVAARKEMFDGYLGEQGASIVVSDLSELLEDR
jgi:beta-phosphoglucomutase-like phosphatase (HAD superfamily)